MVKISNMQGEDWVWEEIPNNRTSVLLASLEWKNYEISVK